MTQILLRPNERTYITYVNHVEVMATPHDVVLHCGRLPTKFSDDRVQEGGEIVVVDEAVELVIPTSLLDPLIRALTEHREAVRRIITSDGTVTVARSTIQ